MSTSSTFTPLDSPGEAPRAAQPLRWRLWQLASAYLPLLLMLLLALGTWWLAKNSLSTGDDTAVTPARHEPDYQMNDFSVQRYTATGSLRGQIEGKTLRHYPDTDTLEIDNVRLRAIGTDGRATTATAHRAVSDGAGTEVQLLGEADVVRESAGRGEPVHFRSEFLHAFLNTERIVSDQPVTVVSGNALVKAEGMEYTHADQVIRFTGRTRATFTPKAKP